MAQVRAKPGKSELYWKNNKEVKFDDAASLYKGGDFAKAANSFRLFILQKPKDPKAKFAIFAMGHCYVELNNPAKAREIFQDFIVKFPGDELIAQANEALEKI